MNWDHWKREVEIFGHQFIGELDEPERWDVYVHSNGINKCLSIYDKQVYDTKLTLEAPTYYDLYRAAQFAWNAHVMMVRGF